MVWLLFLLGCGATINLDAKLNEGQTLEVSDRVQNTVKSIEKGIILEEVRLKTRREVTTPGILGEDAVGWVERVKALRVDRAMSGKESVWDSSLGGKPPKELEGAELMLSRVRDVQVSADGKVVIKEAQAEDLAEGGDPSRILSWDDMAYLDVVDLGLLQAPRGELRVNQQWTTELAGTTHFDHEDHDTRITVDWRVDRIDGSIVQLTQTMSSVGNTTPKEFGFVVGHARGRGTLVFDTEAGVPKEYNEEITYTMASADSEVDQMLTRSRLYSLEE
ncbi:MAG: hypothetical protein EP330_30765 [Deltaproteobacteria bacterium]|nr:MAG: hypothetical protein EP330_30765 [Deltaproteobacteria bacterium]